MKMYHGDKQEDKTSDKQIKGASAGTNKTDGGQDHDIGYEASMTEIMGNIQKSRTGEIRTRIWHIYHKLERLGIDQ